MSASIVVSAALGNKPGNGGEAWVALSWVRGLRDLGFDAWLVEELVGDVDDLESSVQGRWFTDVTADAGLARRAVLVGGGCLGAGDVDEVRQLVADSALVINISGTLRDPALIGAARRSAYVDLDPGFTQIWQANGPGVLGLDAHDLHFTIGEHVGTGRCPLPTGGIEWLPARQPVVLADWPATPPPTSGAFTTVGTWRCAFGPPEHDGVRYGLKVHEFRKLARLPRAVDRPLELAIDIHAADGADRQMLLDHGWRLRCPRDVAGTPAAFRDYVAGSLAELTAVQGVYAEAHTGWCSDRTLRYLASGRPAVVQDTGLADLLPVGEGLLVFDDVDGAAAAVNAVAADPVGHGAAARRLVEQHFAAERVLGAFLDRCGVGQ